MKVIVSYTIQYVELTFLMMLLFFFSCRIFSSPEQSCTCIQEVVTFTSYAKLCMCTQVQGC